MQPSAAWLTTYCSRQTRGRVVRTDRAGTHGRLTVNTSDGTGVRSCGWIMERTEGRWPSLDPTKNSLWMEQRAISNGPITWS